MFDFTFFTNLLKKIQLIEPLYNRLRDGPVAYDAADKHYYINTLASKVIGQVPTLKERCELIVDATAESGRNVGAVAGVYPELRYSLFKDNSARLQGDETIHTTGGKMINISRIVEENPNCFRNYDPVTADYEHVEPEVLESFAVEVNAPILGDPLVGIPADKIIAAARALSLAGVPGLEEFEGERIHITLNSAILANYWRNCGEVLPRLAWRNLQRGEFSAHLTRWPYNGLLIRHTDREDLVEGATPLVQIYEGQFMMRPHAAPLDVNHGYLEILSENLNNSNFYLNFLLEAGLCHCDAMPSVQAVLLALRFFPMANPLLIGVYKRVLMRSTLLPVDVVNRIAFGAATDSLLHEAALNRELEGGGIVLVGKDHGGEGDPNKEAYDLGMGVLRDKMPGEKPGRLNCRFLIVGLISGFRGIYEHLCGATRPPENAPQNPPQNGEESDWEESDGGEE